MTQKIGVFDVLGTIGKGAGSAILKVRRKSDGKTYALKVVTVNSAEDRKFLEQAEHEYLVASRLHHPNLLKAYAFEWTRKLFRIRGAKVLLEYVDGLVLSECRNLPMAALLRTFFKTAEGLAYMHANGYYHADIKPDNIMVTTSGDVKIIDFGLVWRRGQRKDRVQGTLEFLAPEQAKKRIVNAKTDIFNLGATMYRVVTGKPVPVELRQPGSSKLGLDAIIPKLTKLNAEAPHELDDLVRQCIRVKPDERPKTMAEVAARLGELLSAGSAR